MAKVTACFFPVHMCWPMHTSHKGKNFTPDFMPKAAASVFWLGTPQRKNPNRRGSPSIGALVVVMSVGYTFLGGPLGTVGCKDDLSFEDWPPRMPEGRLQLSLGELQSQRLVTSPTRKIPIRIPDLVQRSIIIHSKCLRCVGLHLWYISFLKLTHIAIMPRSILDHPGSLPIHQGLQANAGCSHKMAVRSIPFWGRCTTHVSLF